MIGTIKSFDESSGRVTIIGFLSGFHKVSIGYDYWFKGYRGFYQVSIRLPKKGYQQQV